MGGNPRRARKTKIRAALATQWPELRPTDHTKPLIDPHLNPTYFVLAGKGSLVAYARTIWTRVEAQGYDLKPYGLGDMV